MPCPCTTGWRGFVKGLPAVGYAPHYGAFPHEPSEAISYSDVLDGWQEHSAVMMAAVRPGLPTHSCSSSPHVTPKRVSVHRLQRASALRPRPAISFDSEVRDHAGFGLIDDGARGSRVRCFAPHFAGFAHPGGGGGEALGQVPGRPAWSCGTTRTGSARSRCTMRSSLASRWQSPLSISRFDEALGRRFLSIIVSMYFDDSHITVLPMVPRRSGVSGFSTSHQPQGPSWAVFGFETAGSVRHEQVGASKVYGVDNFFLER